MKKFATLECDQYVFYCNNRSVKHKKARKGSGGVGMFIKHDILTNYVVADVDRTYEGILVVRLCHKITKYSIAVYSCYLPPENSKFGRDPEIFFEHLLQLTYAFEDCDDMVLFGDFNGRIGELADYIIDVDDIPERNAIDFTVNKHGEKLIEFLREAKIGVVNGRVTTDQDDFTSVSPNGTSVVDYMLTGYESITKVETCKVLLMLPLVDKLNIGHVGRISDHSVLMMKIHTVDHDVYCDANQNPPLIESHVHIDEPSDKPPRFKINKMPTEFMTSEGVSVKLHDLIDQLMLHQMQQKEVDQWYDHFTEVYYSEMHEFFKEVGDTPKSKKNAHLVFKPWWNDHLNDLRKVIHDLEKTAHANKKHKRPYRAMQQQVKAAQHDFDKHVRLYRRRWEREQVLNLEQANTNNPTEFWEQIKRMGRKTQIKYTP